MSYSYKKLLSLFKICFLGGYVALAYLSSQRDSPLLCFCDFQFLQSSLEFSAPELHSSYPGEEADEEDDEEEEQHRGAGEEGRRL